MLTLAFMLSACQTVVTKPSFPKPPDHLMRQAPELKQLPQPLH